MAQGYEDYGGSLMDDMRSNRSRGSTRSTSRSQRSNRSNRSQRTRTQSSQRGSVRGEEVQQYGPGYAAPPPGPMVYQPAAPMPMYEPVQQLPVYPQYPPPVQVQQPIPAQPAAIEEAPSIMYATDAKLRDTTTGEPHPPEFKSPEFYQKRGCTDMICLVVFAMFLFLWTVLASFAFQYGHPYSLIYPSDSMGRICGTTQQGRWNLTKRSYLYFFDLTKCISYSTVFEGCPTTQVCLPRCPNRYASYMDLWFDAQKQPSADPMIPIDAVQAKLYCTDEAWHRMSKGGKEVAFSTLQKEVTAYQCTAYTVKSKPIAGRCVPELILKMGNAVLKAKEELEMNNLRNDTLDTIPKADMLGKAKSFIQMMVHARATGEKLLVDMQILWWQILIFLLISTVVTFIWIVLMRWIGGCMVWISIFALLALMFGVCVFSWNKYSELKKSGTGQDFEITWNFGSYAEMEKTWVVIGGVVTVLMVLFLLMLLFLRKRIQIAIAMIEESSKSVGYMPSCLVFPIVPFLLQMMFFFFWLYVAVNLQSWAKPLCRELQMGFNLTQAEKANLKHTVSAIPCDCERAHKGDNCTFIEYETDTHIPFYQFFNLFSFFWMLCFLSSLTDLSLAGAFSSYYWSFRKPEDIPCFPVWKGMYRALRYHIGSLAFGSFLLVVFKMIRVIIEYIDNKVKGSENRVAKCIMMGCRCCFWLLEKLLKVLTRNAWIMMSIYGNGFVSSARQSFTLLLRNFIRVWVLDKTTDFLLFVGKVLITGGMATLAYCYFEDNWFDNEELLGQVHYTIVPVIIVTIGTYLICDEFFDVYEMAVDTTFLCFLEDSERNDGSVEKPYYMSKKLMQILSKTNQKPNEPQNK